MSASLGDPRVRAGIWIGERFIPLIFVFKYAMLTPLLDHFVSF
jgi:hypothetical protein